MTRSARRALSALTALVMVGTLFVGAPVPVRATPHTYYVGHLVNAYAPGSECAAPDYWTDGDWTGGGAYNSDNDAIQDAADHAANGSVIYICAGTYVFAEVVTVGAGVNLTFRGDGEETTLDGNDITRIFNASPVNASDQGGVLSLRDLLISDAEVTEWNAGAVVADGLSLDNVTITRSSGAFNGGALYAEGNVTIVDSTFTDNIANADGGALYAWNPARTVSVRNSVFSGNYADNQGGAIIGANVTVTGSTFTDNNANYGGAISASTTSVTSSTFVNNGADTYGGAIFATFSTVTSSTFTENTSYLAGAIWSWATATVTGSTFTRNEAVGTAGAVWAVTANVSGSIFTDNGSLYGSGGAVYAQNATVIGSTFTDNTAYMRGGAIGAIAVTIARSQFKRNSARDHGGAVYVTTPNNGGLRQLRGNTFMGNIAAAGGAITLGACRAPSLSEVARMERANRFSMNRATEQQRTNNVERLVEGSCGP
jgi:predicted outer membrane repeat protein